MKNWNKDKLRASTTFVSAFLEVTNRGLRNLLALGSGVPPGGAQGPYAIPAAGLHVRQAS